MSSHTKLHSKADFDKAIATEGRYVLIHAYSNEIFPKAEEYASKYSATCDAYAVDTAAEPKVMEYFGISQVPAAMLYKDGKQVKKIEGKDQAGMEELAKILA